MSKERARRRAEREAAHAALMRRRARQEARRKRWRGLRRRLTLGRRAWGLGRRSAAQRSLLFGAGLLLMAAVWHFVDGWSVRVAFWLLILLLLPVLAVVAFDRKGMRL